MERAEVRILLFVVSKLSYVVVWMGLQGEDGKIRKMKVSLRDSASDSSAVHSVHSVYAQLAQVTCLPAYCCTVLFLLLFSLSFLFVCFGCPFFWGGGGGGGALCVFSLV